MPFAQCTFWVLTNTLTCVLSVVVVVLKESVDDDDFSGEEQPARHIIAMVSVVREYSGFFIVSLE
jgi:hypothetical protein